MCCFLLTLGLLGPRLGFAFLWLFTPMVTDAFGGQWAWPLLGLIFLPWTAIFYTLAWSPVLGVTGAGWALVALGVLLDLLTYSSRAAATRGRPAAAA